MLPGCVGLCDLYCPECYPKGEGGGFIAGGMMFEGTVLKGRCLYCIQNFT